MEYMTWKCIESFVCLRYRSGLTNSILHLEECPNVAHFKY